MNVVFDELEGEVADFMFGGGLVKDANLMKFVYVRLFLEVIFKVNDGDCIFLLCGVYNGFGIVVEIDKRVFIRGEGAF